MIENQQKRRFSDLMRREERFCNHIEENIIHKRKLSGEETISQRQMTKFYDSNAHVRPER